MQAEAALGDLSPLRTRSKVLRRGRHPGSGNVEAGFSSVPASRGCNTADPRWGPRRVVARLSPRAPRSACRRTRGQDVGASGFVEALKHAGNDSQAARWRPSRVGRESTMCAREPHRSACGRWGPGPGRVLDGGPGGPAHWGEGRTPQTRSCPGRWRRDRAQTPSRCRGSAQCPPLSLRPDSRRAPEACGHRSEARGAFPWGLPEKTVEGARKKSFPLISSFSHLAMSLAPLGWVTRLVMKDRPDGRFPPYASVYCD